MPVLNIKKILESLEKEKVRYLLIGGLAAIGHGMNHVTDDLDFCYLRSKENYQSIVRALSPAHPQLRVQEGGIPFLFDEKTISNGLNFTLATDWGWIDLLGEIQGIGYYETMISHSVKFEFYGIQVNTLSLDDLIRAKKAAGRTKDKLHLLELEAIRDIQQNQKKKS